VICNRKPLATSSILLVFFIWCVFSFPHKTFAAVTFTPTANPPIQTLGFGGPTVTFSNVNIGTPSAGRVVVVGVADNAASYDGITGVTIGGVAATEAVFSDTATTNYASLWYASVPTGTTATIVVTGQGSGLAEVGILVGAITGDSSAAPVAVSTHPTVYDSGDPQLIPTTGTVNVPTNGAAVLFGESEFYDSGTPTWTNTTSASGDYKLATSTGNGQVELLAHSYTAGAESYGVSSSNNNGYAFGGFGAVVAAWGPPLVKKTTIAHSNTVALNGGLVGDWTFDGPTVHWGTGKIDDASGQGNTGQMVGMSTTTSVTSGVIGQALKFNGTNSYISESTSISGIETVAFWAKASTTVAIAQGLINLTGSTVYISTNSSKVLSAIGFTSPTYYIDGAASSTPGLYDAKWHHVVVTGTGAITGSQVEIGRGNGVYFGGTLDDVRMYNSVLTYQQVRQLYAMGAVSI
jgi:hypothetical protein